MHLSDITMSNIYVFLSLLLQCFEFDKFVGYSSEDELVKASLDLIRDGKLWAGE